MIVTSSGQVQGDVVPLSAGTLIIESAMPGEQNFATRKIHSRFCCLLPGISRCEPHHALATLGDVERKMNGTRINFFKCVRLLYD